MSQDLHRRNNSNLTDTNLLTWHNSFTIRYLKGKKVAAKLTNGVSLSRGDGKKYYSPESINLTAVLCLDGVDVDKRNSTWPVTLKILDLNNHAADNQSRLMSIPLFKLGKDKEKESGKDKEKEYGYSIDDYFKILFDDCALAATVGFMVHDARDNKLKKVFLTVLTASGDMPALAKLIQSLNVKAYSFCRYCIGVKDTFRTADSNVKIYAVKDEIRRKGLNVFNVAEELKSLNDQRGVMKQRGGNVTGLDFSLALKDKNFRDKIRPLLKQKDLHSIIGFKELTHYFEFDEPTRFNIGPVLDIMHNVLEGLGRKIISLITNSLKREFVYGMMLTKEEIIKINQILYLNRNLPTIFGEEVHDIRIIHKAEIFLNIMIWLPMLINGTSLNNELKHVIIGFAEVVKICFRRFIYKSTLGDITALCQGFVADYERCFRSEKYGEAFADMYTAALHEIIHIPKLLLTFGPLVFYSGFSTERTMAEFKRSHKAKKHATKSLSNKDICLNNIMGCLKLIFNSTFDDILRRRVIENSTEVLSYSHLKNLDKHKAAALLELVKEDPKLKRQKHRLLETEFKQITTRGLSSEGSYSTSVGTNKLVGVTKAVKFSAFKIPADLKEEIKKFFEGELHTLRSQTSAMNRELNPDRIKVILFTNLEVNNVDGFPVERLSKTQNTTINCFNIRKGISSGKLQNKNSICLITNYGVNKKIRDKIHYFGIHEDNPDIQFGIGFIKDFVEFKYKYIKIKLALMLVFENVDTHEEVYNCPTPLDDTQSEPHRIHLGFKVKDCEIGCYKWVRLDAVKAAAHQMHVANKKLFFFF